MIEALKNNTPIDLSSCTQKRDFVGVKDVSRAYLELAKDLERGGFDIFNICSGKATELSKVLEMIADQICAKRDLLHFGKIPPREGEPDLILGDISKIKKKLEWAPGDLSQALYDEFQLKELIQRNQ